MKSRSFIVIIIVFLSGCIELYNHEGVEEIRGLLVVEGTITDDESVFILRRSVGLYTKLKGDETVNDAVVYVEKDNGEQLQGVFKSNETYTVQTGDLNAETKYRLYVKIGEYEYRSEFLLPLYTSEIGSITSSKAGKGEPVNIYLNAHDPNDGSRYYRWSYDEIWEVKAEIFANYGFLNSDEPDYFYLHTPENTYYCWGRDKNKSILIESTNKISENRITQKKLHEIPCDNDRLSILYYILVKQNQIRKEAYEYYSNIQKNVEQTSSIFSPIPSEMEGNIKCVTNPEIPVIGYIDVSTTTRKELFFSDDTVHYYEPQRSYDLRQWCEDAVTPYLPYVGYDNYIYYLVQPPTNPFYVHRSCVDCRLKDNATKDRPDFWPNAHY